MKVIFIQNVAKQGTIGQIKDVADGFALNVLIPKKQAVLATKEPVTRLEKANEARLIKDVVDKNLFVKAVRDLRVVLEKDSNGMLEFEVKNKDKSGALFSQIKKKDIADLINMKIKVPFPVETISLPTDHIKKVGIYEINLQDKNLKESIKLKVL